MYWKKSPTPHVVAYNLYENGLFLVSIPASEKLRYKVTVDSKCVEKEYTVAAVSSDGATSTHVPLNIVNEKC